jgi:peptidoglycan/xylan/chitin deacetylase (PgdA/CDA1 family)
MMIVVRSVTSALFDAFGVFRAISALAPRAVVVMYHRVLDRDDPAFSEAHPGMVVSTDAFRMQVEEFARRFEVVPLERVCQWQKEGAPRRKKPYLAITFDDGWIDTVRTAVPELLRRGMPATVFVTVEYTRQAEVTGSFASRSDLRWLVGQGVDVGCHSWSHREMVGCSDAELKTELVEAKAWIEDLLGREISSFAYPRGRYDAVALKEVRAHFRCGVGVGPGLVQRDSDPAALPRMGLHDDMTRTLALLRWRLAGLP